MVVRNINQTLRTSKAVIDTNLLLLVMFASMNRDPSKDKRLSRYAASDLTLIKNLVLKFTKIIVTPNILTEFSNLTSGYQERNWIANFISNIAEEYVPSLNVCKNIAFVQLGLTDLAFAAEQLDGNCILTDDQPLANHLLSMNKDVILYSEYRYKYLGNYSPCF